MVTFNTSWTVDGIGWVNRIKEYRYPEGHKKAGELGSVTITVGQVDSVYNNKSTSDEDRYLSVWQSWDIRYTYPRDIENVLRWIKPKQKVHVRGYVTLSIPKNGLNTWEGKDGTVVQPMLRPISIQPLEKMPDSGGASTVSASVIEDDDPTDGWD